VIRKLLQGEEVSHDGLITVDRARLWTRPATPPPLMGAAVSEQTARWCAQWADGLITVNADEAHLRAMISAYRAAGGHGPVCLQVHLSYAGTDEEAERIAHDQWRSSVFSPPFCWDTETVEAFDQATEHVPPEALHKTVLISSDPGRHAEWLNSYAALGFDAIYLHHVGQEQSEFIDVFGEKVLSQLEVTRP